MKVFVSYGYAGDQVNALRLQALGAVNGFTVYVPPAYTRQPQYGPPIAPAGFRRPRPLDLESEREIRDSDIVLGVIGSAFTDTCRLELDEAHKAGKPMIVMTNPGHAELFQNLGWNVVQIDPSHPSGRSRKSCDSSRPSKPSQRKKPSLPLAHSPSACWPSLQLPHRTSAAPDATASLHDRHIQRHRS